MTQLRQNYQHITTLNTEVIVVGPEDKQTFLSYWEKEDLPFIGLPDPEHKVLKLYRQEVNIFKLGRMPAQMLVDMSGTLRYVHYGKSMADMPSIENSITVIKSCLL